MFIFMAETGIYQRSNHEHLCSLFPLIQEGKIADLENHATRLIENDHYAKEEIAARLQRVLDRSGMQSPLSASES